MELRADSVQSIEHLAQDIRQKIIETCMANGGHLGASLGAVDLAIALHHVFASPAEPIVWDVGHQAYAHKLLTGRWKEFSSLRATGGISGFLSRDESVHDAFGAGHSSTALSAALAMAWARGREKKNPPWTVAVVGDGGLTAGLALEALNQVRALELGPLLVVLNDNQMSISPNVGAIAQILGGAQAQTFFELFGFEYFGPVDGHNTQALISLLSNLKCNPNGKPILLHVLTQKGQGYEPAVEQPAVYHGVSPLKTKASIHTYSDWMGEKLCELARRDEKIIALSAAMPEGTGLIRFSREFPDRFFDVGIAEPHAVTFAAGLATQGFKPVVAIYSTFLQRSLDQIIHDVALQRLPVIFLVDRAGLVGADGPTHHGVFDLSYFQMIPGIKVFAPSNGEDLERILLEALSDQLGPVAIRYPRGGPGGTRLPKNLNGLRAHGTFRQSPETSQGTLLAFGAQATKLEAISEIITEIDFFSSPEIKPFSKALLAELNLRSHLPLWILEDGIKQGGAGVNLMGELAARSGPTYFLSYDDHFVLQGSIADLEEQEKISIGGIVEKIREKN